MRRLLLDLGARDEQIVVEDTALNTLQSAIRCSAMLRARGDVGEVVVCSSRYHIRRCRMLLRMNGVRAERFVASRDTPKVGRIRYAYAWLREWAALPHDTVLMTANRFWRKLSKGRSGADRG